MTKQLIVKDEKKYFAMLKIAHFVGTEGLALLKFEKLCKLIFTILDEEIGKKISKEFHYVNNKSFLNF